MGQRFSRENDYLNTEPDEELKEPDPMEHKEFEKYLDKLKYAGSDEARHSILSLSVRYHFSPEQIIQIFNTFLCISLRIQSFNYLLNNLKTHTIYEAIQLVNVITKSDIYDYPSRSSIAISLLNQNKLDARGETEVRNLIRSWPLDKSQEYLSKCLQSLEVFNAYIERANPDYGSTQYKIKY